MYRVTADPKISSPSPSLTTFKGLFDSDHPF
nr:MAG TPA: hypothetical protein [Caudoviricetes sp.]